MVQLSGVMIKKFLNTFLGDSNEKLIRKIQPFVDEINAHCERFGREFARDEQFAEKTEEFRAAFRQAQGDNGFQSETEAKQNLDKFLPEAFGLVKAACKRLLGRKWEVRGHEVEWDMVPFDVQLLGAIVLHQGNIAEMKTGEGKTLVCTMPIYLNALLGRGVHVVTVNEYLAHR